MHRNSINVSTKQERIAALARQSPEMVFTSLAYLRLNRQSVAIEFWKAALEAAQADSVLERLCLTELDRVEQKQEVKPSNAPAGNAKAN